MNQKGFGIVELAAWIVVTCFVTKVLIGGLIIGAILKADAGNKLDLKAAQEIQLALAGEVSWERF